MTILLCGKGFKKHARLKPSKHDQHLWQETYSTFTGAISQVVSFAFVLAQGSFAAASSFTLLHPCYLLFVSDIRLAQCYDLIFQQTTSSWPSVLGI